MGREMQIMLSEIQQKNVWEGWLSAEILAHYFGDLAGRYKARQRTLTIATLVFSSAAFAAVVSDKWLPQNWAWLKPVATLIVALISAILVVERYDERVVDCSDLYSA